MRLLIIGNIRKKQGGITTQILELRDSLISEGIDVRLVSTHGSIPERLKSLYRVYAETGVCDVVLGVGCAYYGIFPMLAASLASRLRKKRIFYNFHDGQVDGFLNKYSGLLKLFFGKNDIVVATPYLEKSFLRYGFNPVTISNHFNEVKVKRKKEISGRPKIIWARSFEELYRADIALEAAKSILKRREAEFHFYGGGTKREYYFKKYGDVKGIVFHDFVTREKLLSEYGNFDILINTTDYDNFPMSIVEAGMNGLFVVTSNAGGTASVYNKDEVLFFEKGSGADLEMKLDSLLDNSWKYEYLRENLGKKISNFTWENVRSNWLNQIYNKKENVV